VKWIINKKAKKVAYHFSNEMNPFLIIDDDLDRIRDFITLLTDVKKIENKRYELYTGSYAGKPVTVIGTHMTAGNTAIIVDQAIGQGAQYIFKIGTFGALQKEIKAGDIYLPTGAVRADGLTDAYAPEYYPAVADFTLSQAVMQAAIGIAQVKTGIVHSVNIYSPYYEKPFNQKKYEPAVYQKLKVFGVEMEVSTTYTISSVKGVPAVALLVCSRTWKTQEAALKGKKANWRSEEELQCKKDGHKHVAQIVLKTIASLNDS
jgi:uridine phosphorylase